MQSYLVRQFCTPPSVPLTEREVKALATAEKFEVPFEGRQIPCYERGKGKTILLAHGWGSGASHLVLVGRNLADLNFRVVAFDAPAHSSLAELENENTSNMFEFSRASLLLHAILVMFTALGSIPWGCRYSFFTFEEFPLSQAFNICKEAGNIRLFITGVTDILKYFQIEMYWRKLNVT